MCSPTRECSIPGSTESWQMQLTSPVGWDGGDDVGNPGASSNFFKYIFCCQNFKCKRIKNSLSTFRSQKIYVSLNKILFCPCFVCLFICSFWLIICWTRFCSGDICCWLSFSIHHPLSIQIKLDKIPGKGKLGISLSENPIQNLKR